MKGEKTPPVSYDPVPPFRLHPITQTARVCKQCRTTLGTQKGPFHLTRIAKPPRHISCCSLSTCPNYPNVKFNKRNGKQKLHNWFIGRLID